MLLAFGALMVVLGLLSGGVLTASALGATALEPGWTAGLAYPGLTLLGYGLFVIPANDGPIQWLTRASGALCLLLGMVAIAVLVLRSLGILAFDGGTLTLWWIFGCSLLLGPMGWLGARVPASTSR
ncbi:hypothetical protein [Inhella gelatinilytica]|uniref:Uncharacterized protein n=1 Tax=Inhella gelatinilytica TaxID=2795030 RepID=A0A931IX28_9BURK|nr:hypothetical protein [Inhella gelatinilytica]MBH9551461.1 hypothetical protein [Inhella gelatinilytica]